MFDYTFWAVAVFAAFIVGLSKSGLVGSVGMVGIPLLALVMPARDATGMMLPVLLVMDAFAIWTYRRNADWHILAIMLPGALLGTFAGWALWTVVSDAQVLLFVGVITLMFVVDALVPLRKRLEGLPPSRPWGVFWGGLSGFTSFISHTGAPPFQIYVLPRRLTPVIFAGTTAYYFGIVNAFKLIPFYFLGQLSVTNLETGAILLPFGLVGFGVGVYLVRRISAVRFYQIAYALILVLALKLIYDGVIGVFFTAAA